MLTEVACCQLVPFVPPRAGQDYNRPTYIELRSPRYINKITLNKGGLASTEKSYYSGHSYPNRVRCTGRDGTILKIERDCKGILKWLPSTLLNLQFQINCDLNLFLFSFQSRLRHERRCTDYFILI